MKIKFGAILTGKANVCEPALHPFLSAEFFSVLPLCTHLFELLHENETGFINVLETCASYAQYRTETGFCFASGCQRSGVNIAITMRETYVWI
ncbi:hypothetical protein MC77_017460 [Citrobacter koseri]|nr:hypothetical protein MC77_017460 [Citrobacter koseri]